MTTKQFVSKKIVHIDYGSNGTAGLYIAQILKAYSGPLRVDAYVHSDFPEVRAHGRIFRIFDRVSKFIPGDKPRKILRAIDLYLVFLYLVFTLKRASKEYELYVFVQFFQSFHAYKFLFSRIRKNCTLIVTVHDAVELEHNYPSIIMSARDDIISHADYLLVHNKSSAEKLSYLQKQIFQIPFPLMVSNETGSAHGLPMGDQVRFLFIGHIRPEKGIDELINAWRRLPQNILNRASLTIAGTYNFDLHVNFEKLKNCTLILDYLDDEEFVRLICSSHYVILPYRGGTNSGVLSMASALGRPCITTNLPIFTESPLFEDLLSLGFVSKLDELLSKTVVEHSEMYEVYLERNKLRYSFAQSEFSEKLSYLYENIIRQ